MNNQEKQQEKQIKQEEPIGHSDFITEIIQKDIENQKWKQKISTRFPPEPNGYLHIGHAKSICINFGIADKFGGTCNLRFDDTNPKKESSQYVDSIIEDVKWLGFDWQDRLYYASDYFEKLYDFAKVLITQGDAYVDSLDRDQIRQYRGTLTEPGIPSPYRDRTIEENLALLAQMKDGQFQEGECVVRAKIDMSHPNLLMRDPAIYRIRDAHHHRTKDRWRIYPMYDFTHCISDSIEKITHSICTLEFENNRPLYDWFLDKLKIHHPRQIEFARLNMTYTVLSKRKLTKLIDKGAVTGWDDPRMPTISGMKKRGYTPDAIRAFCEKIGVAKRDSIVDFALLEHTVREDLNKKAKRVMAVLRPVKLVITNYPEDSTEYLDAENNPENTGAGFRKIPFSKELYIEEDDFMENPPKKFFRLSPGKEVRLKHAYYIKCTDVIKDKDTGKIIEIRCTYDPETAGGWSKDQRKVKGTLHWVSAKHALDAKVYLYERLFKEENPLKIETDNIEQFLNPNSCSVLEACKLEPSLKDAKPFENFQFLRLGYFVLDSDQSLKSLAFNRTVALKDTWAKISSK